MTGENVLLGSGEIDWAKAVTELRLPGDLPIRIPTSLLLRYREGANASSAQRLEGHPDEPARPMSTAEYLAQLSPLESPAAFAVDQSHSTFERVSPPTSRTLLTPEDEPLVLSAVEEVLDVSKRTFENGRILVEKITTDHSETIEVPLEQLSYNIERVAIGRVISFRPEIRYEGATMILPVIEETAIVTKQLILIEELHITEHRTTSIDRTNVVLQREQIKATRTDHRSGTVSQL